VPTLSAYFDDVEQQLLTLPNLYFEQFNVTILTAERANLKLRIRFKGKYLLAISEAIVIADGQITQIDYREAEN
jgi:predicted ester cyclase